LGVIAYFAFLRGRVGSWTAWFDVEERGWHMHSDPGISVVTNTVRAFSMTFRFFEHPRGTLITDWMTPFILIAAVALAILLARTRSVSLEVRLYGVVFLVLMFMAGNSYESLPRVIVPAFPLLIPIAVWLARRSTAVSVSVLACSLAAASYLGVLWFDTIRLATHCCAP
jgi:hypothetical protein